MTTTSDSRIFWIKDVEAAGHIFSTRYRNSTITLARFGHDHDRPRLYEANQNDAFVSIIQIGDRPAHDFHFGEGIEHGQPGLSSSFNFADLRSAPSCTVYGPLDNFHLHIPRAALDDIADEADSPPIHRLHAKEGWETADPILESIKQTMLAVCDRPEDASQLFVDHVLLALHSHFARMYGGMRDAQRVKFGGLAAWQLRRAKELIEANIDGQLSVTQIADACGLSSAHFSRAFKASTGFTPHNWLQSYRIERAKDLLRDADFALAEVALACGFADQSHFTRVFTRVAGDTPGAWRRYRLAA